MEGNTNNYSRLWEIDFIRGIAILLMIIFHLIVDLKDFYAYNLDYLRGFWYLEGKLSAILFILICGVSSTLGHRNTRHGSKVFLWALLLTVVTYIYNKSCYIAFGILHFLGISLLSANFMGSLSATWLMIGSCTSVVIGLAFSEVFVTSPFLFPLGLVTSNFSPLDFYPMFPWYGVFLFGIILGKIIYSNKKRLGQGQVLHRQPVIFFESVTWLGQHSLGIYLIHQPILLLLLYLIHGL